MFAAGVVEAVDVLKEGIADLVTRCPSVPPDQFGLEGFEEGLDGSIVVAVALAAHRYLEAHFPQPLLIIVRTILAASVGVMNAALRRVAKGHGIVQCLQSQITFQAIAELPNRQHGANADQSSPPDRASPQLSRYR